jgi:hypothetical protein
MPADTTTDTIEATQFAAIDHVDMTTILAPLRLGICGSGVHVLQGHHRSSSRR